MSREAEKSSIIIMTASDYVNSGVILTSGDSVLDPLPSHTSSNQHENVAAAIAAASGHKMLSSTMAISGCACTFLVFAKAAAGPIWALYWIHSNTQQPAPPKWTHEIKFCSIFRHKVDHKRDIRGTCTHTHTLRNTQLLQPIPKNMSEIDLYVDITLPAHT